MMIQAKTRNQFKLISGISSAMVAWAISSCGGGDEVGTQAGGTASDSATAITEGTSSSEGEGDTINKSSDGGESATSENSETHGETETSFGSDGGTGGGTNDSGGAVCGNGIIEEDEPCDDGNADNTDDCVIKCDRFENCTCAVAMCGDGFVHTGQESCDDGMNVGGYYGCREDCSGYAEYCGDGVKNGDESCDDGDDDDYDGCPTSCESDHFLVFLTRDKYSGNLGGTVGADMTCQAQAAKYGLSGTYKAWLSTKKLSAVERFFKIANTERPFYLRNGALVAEDWDDLTTIDMDMKSYIKSPINIYADKNLVVSDPKSISVWTHTHADGAKTVGDSYDVCSDWTEEDPDQWAISGNSPEKDTNWTAGGISQCSKLNYLYCFQVDFSS